MTYGNYETAKEIEIAVATKWFGVRRNLIVPNVSWGFLPYEADLLILTNSKYAWEVEIKVSRQDLIRDASKGHNHACNKIRQLWFAIPEKLMRCLEFVPAKAGILVVDRKGFVREQRPPAVNTQAIKLTDEEVFTVCRLGALRVWSLKEQIHRAKTAKALEPI